MRALRTALLTTFLVAVAFASSAQAAPAAARGCLDLTATRGLDTSKIADGLGLSPDQVREVRGRLSQYGGFRPFTLDGLGLTPEQIAEINRRIGVQVAAMNKHPVGWPCAPFKNRAKVVAFMRAQLIFNGFRPNMTFSAPSMRQIGFVAIQDGQRYLGRVAKYGPRQIRVALTCVRPCLGGGATYNLPFEA